MFTDLAFLPESLHMTYIESRITMQFPVCFLLLAATFLPNFAKHYQAALSASMLSIIFINYWLIIQCWEQAGVVFSYEGTVMYSLFSMFVFRMSFKFAMVFSAATLLGFVVMVLMYPMYGDYTGINVGFVLMSLFIGLLGTYRIESGIRKLTQLNDKLTTLSETDPLTSLLNRRTYEARFSKQFKLAQRGQSTLCVFVIDLDYFKDFNDGYGHVRGDKIIQQQASNLSAIFKRETDIVARYGGEEFIVVTTNVTESQCHDFANQLLAQWQQLAIPHGKGRAGSWVTCSIGFYWAQMNPRITKESIVKLADQALYEAKEKGRNCFVQYCEK
ncbi:hypothetical protein KUL49_25600 [Alteromonas sp. KUL49]|nr:hypothetical protein KUL49_25600 [Alteromonas sp. KUL49]